MRVINGFFVTMGWSAIAGLALFLVSSWWGWLDEGTRYISMALFCLLVGLAFAEISLPSDPPPKGDG